MVRISRSFAAVALFAASLAVASPAAAQLGGRSAEEWIKTLDSQTRLQSLKVDEVVAALKLKPGMTVADIGAGTGIFTIPLAAATRPGGKVYAVDLDEGLLKHIKERAAAQNAPNVETIKGAFTDPNLPNGSLDLAFICDVLHHIQDRAPYIKALAADLKPGGRIAVVDFKPEMGGHRGQPEMQVSPEQANGFMTAAGLKQVEEIKLFEDKYFVIWAKP